MKHKHCEVIKAWADGALIEWLDHDGNWIETTTPAFYKDTEYRVMKVTKLVKVEGWLNVYASSGVSQLYKTKEDAEEYYENIPHKTIFISEEIEVDE